MGITVNVGIGGTFTDFCATAGEGAGRTTKSPTTHYDLSVGFMNGIKSLARDYGQGLNDFLGGTDAVLQYHPGHQCPDRA